MRSAGTDDVVERDGEQPARLVDRWRALDAQPGRGGVHRDRRDASLLVARRDDEHVGDVGIEHEARGPVQAQRTARAPPRRSCRRARSYEPSVPANATEPSGAPLVSDASSSSATLASSASISAPLASTALARNGDGVTRAPELVEDDREIAVAAAGATALVGHVDRRPSQLDHRVPERAVEARRFGDRGAHRSLDDSPSSRLRAVVRSSSRSSSESGSYRGRPSMRSPITFRWISFVPPPMSQPNEWM